MTSRPTVPSVGSSLASRGSSSPFAMGGFVVKASLAGAVLAVPAAWIWASVANPPRAELTTRGVSLGESQLNQQSEITLWFLVVGFAVGAAAGLVAGLVGRRRGVATVAAVVAMCLVGAALTAFLGISVFGPDAEAELARSAVGESITSDLRVDSLLAYLGWPIGGLAGLCVAIYTWPVTAKDA
jgi:hypothetical protein